MLFVVPLPYNSWLTLPTLNISDIQATVNSIQIKGGDDGGVVNDVRDCPLTDSTDYQEEFDRTESEVEAILKDSIEEFYSFSDSDQNWFLTNFLITRGAA